MKTILFNINKDNPDMGYYIHLQESAIGFLTNCRILYDNFKDNSNNDVAENMWLQTPYYTNLLQAVELLLKVLLLGEGHKLKKLKTHKIYDLYRKLKPDTQNYLKVIIDGSGKHWYKLEDILKLNNDKFTRFRYHDLAKSCELIFKGADILLDFGLFLCKCTGFAITKNGKPWEPY